MEPNTTGQRIAQRRKMLGLSQEALGQQLGVSRQAISKWESDAATPEINKLIALSHLFSVSVGWLLCEEADPNPANSEAFTENQLRLLEKVIQKQPAMPKWQKVLVILTLCVTLLCGVASLVLALRANNRADDAHVTYRDQISWLYENYGGAQSQLDAISAQLRDLQEQDDPLSDYEFSAVAWTDWSGADVTFTGHPQTWNDSDTGFLLVLRGGVEIARTEAVWDGFRLTATVGLEKQNDLEYHFLRSSADGSRVQQELYAPGYAHLIGRLHFYTDGRANGWYLDNGQFSVQDFSYSISPPQIFPTAQTVRWEKLDLVLYLNEAEIGRISILEMPGKEELAQAYSSGDEDCWSALTVNLWDGDELSFQVPELRQGDKLSLRVESVLRTGDQRTEFEQELQFWHYQNGALE